MRNNHKLLGLLFVGIATAIPCLTISNTYSEVKAMSDYKPVFIDLSLNEVVTNPYVKYNDGDEHDIELTLVSNDIYRANIPVSVFTDNETYGFAIYGDDNYHSDFISGNSVLKEKQYNYVCLSVDASIKGYGWYGVRTNNPGATYKTQRVWLMNDNQYFYSNDEWGTPCVNAVGYEYNNVYTVITMKNDGTGIKNLYYADIPYELTSVHFLRIANSNNHNYLVYLDKQIESLSYGTCYIAGTKSLEDFTDIKTGVVGSVNIGTLALVVESYLTYGKSPSNGAVTATIQSLYKTWFDNKAATKQEMKEVKIYDYTGYAANNNSYEGLTKNAQFSVNEKWNTICSQAGVDPNNGQIRSGINIEMSTLKILLIILLPSLLVIGGVTTLFIYQKRKKYKNV